MFDAAMEPYLGTIEEGLHPKTEAFIRVLMQTQTLSDIYVAHATPDQDKVKQALENYLHSHPPKAI